MGTATQPETERVSTGVLECMSSEGDLKVMWDKDSPEEVQAAREQFNKLTKEGYRAFKATKLGGQGSRIEQFDPTAERIVLVRQYQGG